MELIYLDNNATTRPADAVAQAVARANADLWANPSSVHRLGQQVRQAIELARHQLARLIGARPRELVLTSGGTESNTLAIRGLLDAAAARGATTGEPAAMLLTTAVEHAAVREPAEALAEAGGSVEHAALDAAGRVDPEAFAAQLGWLLSAGPDDRVVLVSVQWANNETGVIQPVAELGQAVGQARDAARAAGRRVRVYLHLDATQAVGKLPVDAPAVGADLLTFSSHKFHGPKGVGGLYVRRGVRLRPVQRGGPQERQQRGGTENTAGVIGAGVAAELAAAFLADPAEAAAQAALRDRFEAAVRAAVPGVVVNPPDPAAERLWNTSNLGFPGLEAEAILLGLSERGLCASAGAACSSGSLEPSPVLLAMGVPEAVAHGSVRFSLSRDTTAEEIDAASAVVPEVVRRLGRTMPMAV